MASAHCRQNQAPCYNTAGDVSGRGEDLEQTVVDRDGDDVPSIINRAKPSILTATQMSFLLKAHDPGI